MLLNFCFVSLLCSIFLVLNVLVVLMIVVEFSGVVPGGCFIASSLNIIEVFFRTTIRVNLGRLLILMKLTLVLMHCRRPEPTRMIIIHHISSPNRIKLLL